MHDSIYPTKTVGSRSAPINVFPHHPPLGPKWGFTGGIDTKLLPHYGAFDTSIDSIFDISIDTSIDISIFDILCLPHCGEFDIRVCQIPTIAPYNPEGGVVGEYIDRCIGTKIHTLINFIIVAANSELSLSCVITRKQ